MKSNDWYDWLESLFLTIIILALWFGICVPAELAASEFGVSVSTWWDIVGAAFLGALGGHWIIQPLNRS